MAWLPVTRVRFAALAGLFSFLAFIFIFSSPEISTPTQPLHERRSGNLESIDQIHTLSSNQSLHRRAEDYSCSKDKPCSNSACCGAGGYCGYGPTYCGDGCQANCDAFAECGKFAKSPGLTCPLNVCCSEFGFCGTTQDFCEGNCQSNCGQPSVPSGANSRSVRDKVIVYYEAWSSRRKCKPFQPWNIPTGSVTHVNFAFAYIDPDSYEITTMDSETPASLFQETTAIKSMKSGTGATVEVYVSIGGWTFFNDGTVTQPVFSDIASSSENRQKFADNLVQFMVRYGFDGVDLDWEYPGAPDRGGKEEDTANFILLIRTLRSTFDRSARGSYGLTFTIPSSYWYLRWFDVPSLLNAGADWVNLMSYDLHGVWDRNNPIGSIVQGHSNLTEIKLAAELLWRNDVAPGKVVLGTGFYGRSFTLENPKCSTPGCQFSGAAKKGDCTDEGGILGFFEIQDILKNGDGIEKIHDKEAAVKYFTFDKDQWVSYDDAETFDQKVEWADSIGLGGLMTWAIDLDDEHFTALSGLIGKPAGKGLNKALAQKKIEIATWSSENGQDCFATDCGEHCPIDHVIATTFASNCGKGYRHFCCPRDRAPRDCTWRGGETGGPGRACHGQCHNGELALLFDGYGSRHCATGQQAFCCTAERYKDVVSGCQLGDCGGNCDKFPGTMEVEKQYHLDKCWKHLGSNLRPMCCEQPMDCHWVGKGGCGDTSCGTDLQIAQSSYGRGPSACSITSRKKSLCCGPPNLGPLFTPVELENIFPEVPPVTDPVKWDLQTLDSGFSNTGGGVGASNVANDPNLGSFGFVLIAGPSDVVSSFSKRDASDIEFVDCSSITHSRRQVTRIFCSNDSDDSNCDDILEGGVDGTMVRMPDACGLGTYIVVHSLKESDDQDLPNHLFKRKAATKPILDLEFSYDFGLMKRANEDVYLRIDYSNMPGYWDAIVDSPSEKKKRSGSIHPRNLPQKDLEKRFFSSDSASWGERLDDVDATRFWTDFDTSAKENIINEEIKGCEKGSYLTMSTDGKCSVEAKFGFTMIGTLQPFNIEQAYGFVDLKYDLDVTVDVSGSIGIDTEYRSRSAHITPESKIEFTEPGIVSFKPSFDLGIGLEGKNASFSGDFSAHFRSLTDPQINNGFVRTTLPYSAGGTLGSIKGSSVTNPFKGHLRTYRGNVELSIIPEFSMEITLDKSMGALSKRSDPDVSKRDLPIGDSNHLMSYVLGISGSNTLSWHNRGMQLSVDSLNSRLINYGDSSLSAWASDESYGFSIGEQPGRITIHEQSLNEEDTAPGYDHHVTPWTIFKSDVLVCPADKDRALPTCFTNICDTGVLDCPTDIELATQPSDSSTSRKRSTHLHKHRRGPVHGHAVSHGASGEAHEGSDIRYSESTAEHIGSRGVLNVREPRLQGGGSRDYNNGECLQRATSNMLGFSYKSYPYPGPNYGWDGDEDLFDNAYDILDPTQCTEASVKGHVLPTSPYPRWFAVEHIMELQTFSIFTTDLAANIMPDGSPSGRDQVYCDFMRTLTANSLPKNVPPVAGCQTVEIKPMSRIMQVHGNMENWEDFHLLEEEINAMKGRIWKQDRPMSDENREAMNSDTARWPESLVTLRTIIAVFNYINAPPAHASLVKISKGVYDELARANDNWVAQGNTSTGVARYWREWIKKHLEGIAKFSKDWAEMSAAETRAFWEGQDEEEQPAKTYVLAGLAILEAQFDNIRVDLSNFD